MPIDPSPRIFEDNYNAGKAQMAWTSLVRDEETPISVYRKLAEGKPYSFLLESVVGGNLKDRYSFIGMAPDLVWTCKRGISSINRQALSKADAFERQRGSALQNLRALVAETRMDLPEGLPPFPVSAGLFGYLAYDMIREIERIPDTKPDPLGVEDSILIRPSILVAFDAVGNRITLMTPIYPQAGVNASTARADAEKRLNAASALLDKPVTKEMRAKKPLSIPTPSSNTTFERYKQMVERGIEYIRAGDVFQVVLSQRFSLPFPLPAFALYRTLRRLNPSPFLFFLDFGRFQLVGSSPEILVRLRDDKVTIRPIAGTRPRQADKGQDEKMAAELLADPKERAEHLMLLDLGRNDVGRVAEPGSVKVTDSFGIEYYSHVMHIVSNVEGAIAPKKDALDALFAGFPAGTVSGAPKIRAMEIIEELEAERRGPYAGCVGYIGANGTLDTCITLRTALVKDGVMYVQAGGGVVADSTPEYEYNETQAKARALIRAAEEALKEAD
jgi:anthranilate synthase component 1